MNREESYVPKFEYLILVLVMMLAFYIAFIPHLNYPYPVHLDEWNHLACANQIIKQATVSGLTDPYFGGAPSHNQIYEVGYHLVWVVFHQVSGLPMGDIFHYFAGIVFAFTVLSVYILARRQGFGWEAALLACLIPTTVGILGPAFMVPMALALLYIPLCLFVAYHCRNPWSYAVLFIFTTFLAALHGPTAVIMVIIVAPYLLINLKSEFKHSAAAILAIGLPFLVTLPWTWEMIVGQASYLLVTQDLKTYVDYPMLTRIYGYPALGLCLLGTFLLVYKGGRKNYGLVFGLLAILLVLAIFFSLHYGLAILYERGLVPMMLMASVVGGAGLMQIRRLKLPPPVISRMKPPWPRLTGLIGPVLCLLVIGITLAVSIPAHYDVNYYHMIDSEDYEAFLWIKENVDSSHTKAILDPWKATAFTAITGRQIYSRISEFPQESDRRAYDFLGNGCRDTAFLEENGISIVYTRQAVANPDLEEVGPNVYLLRETIE